MHSVFLRVLAITSLGEILTFIFLSVSFCNREQKDTVYMGNCLLYL